MFRLAIICNLLLAMFLNSLGYAQDNGENVSDEYMKYYRKIVKEERNIGTKKNITENLAAGIAATLIGFYGYYFDNRGLLAKVAYSATQTLGVVTISDSIYNYEKPSFLLLADKHLRKNGVIKKSEYIKGVVNINKNEQKANLKKAAITGGILSGIYAYNGHREQEVKNLKNVFFFLSFNFAIISGISTIKLLSWRDEYKISDSSFSLKLFPNPVVTYVF